MFEWLETFIRKVIADMETKEDAKLFLKILERHVQDQHNISLDEFIIILEGMACSGRDKNGIIDDYLLEKIRYVVPQLKFVVIIANEG